MSRGRYILAIDLGTSGCKAALVSIQGKVAAWQFHPVWCQIFADVLDRPVKQVTDPIQANVRGAAFIASVGLGLISFHDIPRYTEYQATYLPRPETRLLYDALFREFVNIYQRNKSIFRRLNTQRRGGARPSRHFD